MIQDIFPHVLNNQYHPETVPAGEDFIIHAVDSALLVRLNSQTVFPRRKEFPDFPEAPVYLFRLDGENYYLLRSREMNALPGYAYVGLREIREHNGVPLHKAFAANTAKHLADWYRDNRFCGRCGAPTEHSELERATRCPRCGYTCYPRIMPAVIVGVINGDTILITRYKTGFRHNALIAGFVEIGETAEETVRREVMEEVGLRVKNIRYYKSQPWGMANDLLLGFYCDVDGDTAITLDGSELGSGQWTRREDIVLQPDNYSLTNEMMRMFKEGRL